MRRARPGAAAGLRALARRRRPGPPVHRRRRHHAGHSWASTWCGWGSSGRGSSPGRPTPASTTRTTAPRTQPGTPFPRLARGTDPYNPATVRAYLARTDRIVALLAHAGLRVIVDMHSDAYGSAFFNAKGTHAVERRGCAAVGHVHRGRALSSRPRAGAASACCTRSRSRCTTSSPTTCAATSRASTPGCGRRWPGTTAATTTCWATRSTTSPTTTWSSTSTPSSSVTTGARSTSPSRAPSTIPTRSPRPHRRDPVRRSHPRRLLRAQRGHGLRRPRDDRHRRAAALPAPGPGLPHLRPDPQAAGAAHHRAGADPHQPTGRAGVDPGRVRRLQRRRA